MPTRIIDFSDGSYLEFDSGRFDKYCVYICQPDGTRKAPLDSDYFKDLVTLAERHGREIIWNDFLKIYEMTSIELDSIVNSYISKALAKYEPDQDLAKQAFYVLYAGMIAENNKEFTKLGKRIKRLGVHSLLVENQTIEYSVSFMKELSWIAIDTMCIVRGF